MATATYPDARAVLLEARTRLVERLNQLGAEATGELRPDLEFGDGFADAAAATAERTEVLGMVDSLKKNLDDVDLALRRLDEGLYGICLTCGREISAGRLAIRPEAVHCIDCKVRSGS